MNCLLMIVSSHVSLCSYGSIFSIFICSMSHIICIKSSHVVSLNQHMYVTGDWRLLAVEGLYCKRPIQCLASSKILTGECESPRLWCGGGLTRWVERRWGVSEAARHCSVLYICKYEYFVMLALLPPPPPNPAQFLVQHCPKVSRITGSTR